MADRKASIWTYKKVDGKWKYCKPECGRNNKIKPDREWRTTFAGAKGLGLTGRSAAAQPDATVAQERQEAYLTAYVHGLTNRQE